MTFLNPLVLLGLAAAAIPLIIHLFNFRRPRRVEFSSLEFLKELQQSTMRRMRVKQWLLLVLRTLAIACLVLAFARPTVEGDWAGPLGARAPTSAAIVLDNSLSMTLRDAQGGYLDQSKAVAIGIAERMEAGDELYLVTTADRPDTEPARYGSAGGALDALDEIEPQPVTSTGTRALARAAAALEEAEHLNRELYFVSDLQASTFADSLGAFVPEGVRLVLVPLGERQQPNVAVTDVQVASRIVEEGQPVRIEATLVNYGDEALADYGASVYLEGDRVAQASATLEPGVPTAVSFTATPQRRGWLGGAVEVEDDAFADDNVRHFTLHVPERRRLLVVRGEGQQDDFLRLAFSQEVTGGRVAFDVERIAESALGARELGTYDAVVLVGPRDLSSGEVAALERYVEAGGGLLLFPAQGAKLDDYNGLLRALGGGAFSGSTGALGGQRPRPVASFERVDLEHPLFEGVFDRGERGGQPEGAEVYHALNYRPGGGAEQTLIQLSNSFPFLQEIRHGSGAVFVSAVALDRAWSDLPVRGLFVPLLYRSAYYLSAGESVAGEQLTLGAPGELRLTGVGEAEPLRLVGPEGQEFAPEQRTLLGATLVETDATARTPGVYDVRAGDRLVRRVAFNLDRRESDLRALDAETAQARLEEATGREVRVLDIEGGALRATEALATDRAGVELWNVFLLLALGFLVAEMMVARQWQPEKVAA